MNNKANKAQSHLVDIIKNYNPIYSNSDRILKMVSVALSGIKDPEDGNHISNLTDLSSLHSLRWIKLKMEETEEGRRILKLKPRVTEQTLNFNHLKEYKENTLGHAYYKYMSENQFTPDERPVAKYIPDVDLAYVCQRYKETHDFYHVLLNYGRSVPDEIAVKWFEALHLRLPSSSLAGIFGPLRLPPSEIFTLYSKYLPHVINNSQKCKFIMGYFFEERMNENIDKLRKEINLTPLH
jgi:ubiquinone biosynthesis protein COQ4